MFLLKVKNLIGVFCCVKFKNVVRCFMSSFLDFLWKIGFNLVYFDDYFFFVVDLIVLFFFFVLVLVFEFFFSFGGWIIDGCLGCFLKRGVWGGCREIVGYLLVIKYYVIMDDCEVVV